MATLHRRRFVRQIVEETSDQPVWGTGTVRAVTGMTVTLNFRGAELANIPVLASYTPQGGDVVHVLHGGGQMIILGKAAA